MNSTLIENSKRVCGAMDNASDYESGDCRFESCQTRNFLLLLLFFPKEII